MLECSEVTEVSTNPWIMFGEVNTVSRQETVMGTGAGIATSVKPVAAPEAGIGALSK